MYLVYKFNNQVYNYNKENALIYSLIEKSRKPAYSSGQVRMPRRMPQTHQKLLLEDILEKISDIITFLYKIDESSFYSPSEQNIPEEFEEYIKYNEAYGIPYNQNSQISRNYSKGIFNELEWSEIFKKEYYLGYLILNNNTDSSLLVIDCKFNHQNPKLIEIIRDYKLTELCT